MKHEQIRQEYLDGIKEGRQLLKAFPEIPVEDHIDNLKNTMKGFSRSSSIGQVLTGELDFWLNQKEKAKA